MIKKKILINTQISSSLLTKILINNLCKRNNWMFKIILIYLIYPIRAHNKKIKTNNNKNYKIFYQGKILIKHNNKNKKKKFNNKNNFFSLIKIK